MATQHSSITALESKVLQKDFLLQERASLEAWKVLSSNSDAVLIDIRSPVETSLTGEPDLSKLGKEIFSIPWISAKNSNAKNNFLNKINHVISDKVTQIFFICRIGIRSRQVVQIARIAGYSNCYSILDVI